MAIQMVLADAQPLFLDGLENLCAQHEDFVPVARCQEGEEALDAVRQYRPDVFILDLPLGTPDGLSVLCEIKQQKLGTRSIILTADISEDQAIEAMRLGVKGVFLKTLPSHLLVQCIRKVHDGGQWLEKQSIGIAIEKMLLREAGARRLANILTPREIEILRLAAAGKSNQQIAEQLLLKQGTVKIHLHNMFKKLGMANRVSLTLYGQKMGLV
jgi:DNA-binding NarL/FixJ family response regulator